MFLAMFYGIFIVVHLVVYFRMFENHSCDSFYFFPVTFFMLCSRFYYLFIYIVYLFIYFDSILS